MTRLLGLSLLSAVITLLLLLPCAAFAGGEATMIVTRQPIQAGDYSTDKTSTTMAVTWRDADTMRIDMGEQAYFLRREGKTYMISQDEDEDDGETDVSEMDFAGPTLQLMRSKGAFGSIDSVEATAATETVAGIKGGVYQIRWSDANGAQTSAEMVLTDNPLVVEMTRAYLGTMGGTVGPIATGTFEDNLPDHDRGLLRLGDHIRFSSISRADPPAATFKLPSQSTDM